MNWKQVVGVVTGCAIFGMVLGGVFGFAAGKLTPDFFRQAVSGENTEPVGAAVFLGATAGVLLGGGLGCFAIAIHTVWQRRKGNQAVCGLAS